MKTSTKQNLSASNPIFYHSNVFLSLPPPSDHPIHLPPQLKPTQEMSYISKPMEKCQPPSLDHKITKVLNFLLKTFLFSQNNSSFGKGLLVTSSQPNELGSADPSEKPQPRDQLQPHLTLKGRSFQLEELNKLIIDLAAQHLEASPHKFEPPNQKYSPKNYLKTNPAETLIYQASIMRTISTDGFPLDYSAQMFVSNKPPMSNPTQKHGEEVGAIVMVPLAPSSQSLEGVGLSGSHPCLTRDKPIPTSASLTPSPEAAQLPPSAQIDLCPLPAPFDAPTNPSKDECPRVVTSAPQLILTKQQPIQKQPQKPKTNSKAQTVPSPSNFPERPDLKPDKTGSYEQFQILIDDRMVNNSQQQLDNAPTKHPLSPPSLPSYAQSQIQVLQVSPEEDDLTHLTRVNKSLRKSGLFGMVDCWGESFKELLLRLTHHWDIYRQTFEAELCFFIRLNEFKLLALNPHLQNPSQPHIYELLYPQISSVLKTLLDRLDLSDLFSERQTYYKQKIGNTRKQTQNNSKRRQMDAMFQHDLMKLCNIEKDIPADLDFQNFVVQYHTFIHNDLPVSSEFENRFGVSLKQAMLQQNPLYHTKQTSLTIIQRVLASVSRRKPNPPGSSPEEHQQRVSQFMEEMQFEKIPNMKCLGCSQFFHNGLNLHDKTICTTPLKVFPSILRVKNNETELKDWICALLNSGGGVILFDCLQFHDKVIPQGQFLTQKRKDEIQQKLTSYFQSFHPRVQTFKNVKISFIPLKQNPYASNNPRTRKEYAGEEGTIKQNQWYYERDLEKGFYVTRLRVRPSSGTDVYFWYQNQNKHLPKQDKDKEELQGKYCSVLQGDKPNLLSMGQMMRLIRKKFHTHYIPESYSKAEQRLMRKPYEVFDHECSEAESVPHIIENKVKEVKSPSKKVAVKGGPAIGQFTNVNQDKYEHMTLLIARRNDLERITAKLVEAGIDCVIEVRFEEYKLKPAHNSAIIYHDKTFELVRSKLVNDSRFNFANGRAVLLISIGHHLKLEGRSNGKTPSEQQIAEYQQWVRLQFPDEKVNLLSSGEGNRTEFYLKTEGRLSTLFLYLMLMHKGEKVLFWTGRDKLRPVYQSLLP